MGAHARKIISILFGCIFLVIFQWYRFHKFQREATVAIVDSETHQEQSGFVAMPMVTPLDNRHPVAALLDQHLGQNYGHSLQQSDFVELNHCSLDALNWTKFTSWASGLILQENATLLESSPPLETFDNQTQQSIRREWMLELLEIYSTELELCDFKDYRFQLKIKGEALGQLVDAGQQLGDVISRTSTPSNHVRIAFVIVAFQDAAHLKRLIEAIHMPHHAIVIHLETSVDVEFETQVRRISKDYTNVIVVKFGTVVYKTDSISRINLQIMNWLVNELRLPYDYHVTLGGAVYPLYGASELAQYLYNNSKTMVWLGELTQRGKPVTNFQWGLLQEKRLVATLSKATVKLGNLFQAPAPDWIKEVMRHKSASGNQAVFKRWVVQMLLKNRRVPELFALGKYGCCCCLEERIWIAAMHILGYLEGAKDKKAMFQLWGGRETCTGKSSMQNAVLDLNETRCYRSENPKYLKKKKKVYGHEMWDRLQAAKADGVLFARKFRSSHNGSMELLNLIRDRLHDTR